MSSIRRPPSPEKLPERPFEFMCEQYAEHLVDYLAFSQPTTDGGKYLPYDQFRHRVPKDLDVDMAWALTKESRAGRKQHLLILGKEFASFVSTAMIQKSMMLVDQNTTTAMLEWTIKELGEQEHIRYLFSDLIEDESISSSQLEGAATTTVVAKDMLKRKREPRSMDEKMILGNFRMMRFAWDHREENITPDFICNLHAIGVEGINDDQYIPGVFRESDDVVVEDQDGNIAHQPPPARGLKSRIKKICEWVNTSHDEIESTNYIHPLLKAVVIHFSIGYEHPFRDGNGRVARALFYWFMFKKNYGAFRYISISNLLKEAAAQYGKSYLYTETDEMDLTYFIDYQCSIIMRSVSAFKAHCQKAIKDIESFNQWLWKSGIYKQLNEKQKIVFQVAKSNIATEFTATNVKENLGCSYNTAAAVLNGLVDLKVFGKRKDGREWVFYLLDKNHIQHHWKA